MRCKVIMAVILWMIAFWRIPVSADASEPKQRQEQKQQTQEQTEAIRNNLVEQLQLDEIEGFLENNFADNKMGFEELVKSLASGNTKQIWESIFQMISDRFFYEFRHTKSTMVHILLLVIIAAVFHNFSNVFSNSQVSEIGFYVLYMLLITICINSFRVLITSTVDGIGGLLSFLKLLSPVYFLAVAIATGSATSVAFYHVILILVCIVEMLIQSILLPIVQIYIVIRVLNNLSAEAYLSKLAELLQTVITWSLRTLLGSVIGINLVQGLLNPAIDAVKRSVITRSGEAIPIIGNAIGGTAEVILGTAVLLKNGIGVAGAIICVVLCMSPVIQMMVVTLMYKLVAALTQPISDNRIVECISSMSDGTAILLKVLLTSCTLFLITIAMVAVTTT